MDFVWKLVYLFYPTYIPLSEIIDQRLDNQWHWPLYVVGYCHNHMYDCLDRLMGDIDEIRKNDAQIKSFKSKSRFFGV